MYTKAAVWATSATPLPMWDVDSSGMVHLPNVVAVFRDRMYLDIGIPLRREVVEKLPRSGKVAPVSLLRT
jgi:hypothetical protein